jgi:hypothetical protein
MPISRAACRQHSASINNCPCAPHLLTADRGSTIQWSAISGEGASASPAFCFVLGVDEAAADCGEEQDLIDDVASASASSSNERECERYVEAIW